MEDREVEIKRSQELFDTFRHAIVEWENILGEGSPEITHAGLTALFHSSLEHAPCVHGLMGMIGRSMATAVDLCTHENCGEDK